MFLSPSFYLPSKKHVNTIYRHVSPDDCLIFSNVQVYTLLIKRGCRGRDRMLVGFTTIYAISAYHH